MASLLTERLISAPLRDTDRLAALRLIRSENVGPVTFYQLLARYGSPAKALEAAPELARKGGRRQPIRILPADGAEREMESAARAGARILTVFDAAYPAPLKAIYDPPPVLTFLGAEEALAHSNAVAVVGARNASLNACRFARQLSEDLARAEVAVISGLARGIDTHAHAGALGEGITLAVTACGIDVIYPPENEPLARRIVERGAILTEQPFGAAPHARAFPARNRIIAGLARGTVVVEASLKSGSLITASYARNEGREVFAVPGFPADPRATGANALLRQGATLVENAEDVLSTLRYPGLGPKPAQQSALWEEAPAFTSEAVSLAEEEEIKIWILNQLDHSPLLTDDLLTASPFPSHAILTILLELELAGQLQRHPGGLVARAYD